MSHVQCADCAKCRVVQSEKWCWNCLYWSCERAVDCEDTSVGAGE